MTNTEKSELAVAERWLLRNGSYVIVTHRLGNISMGHIEETLSIQSWTDGISQSGRGYDLKKQMENSNE